MRSGDRAGHDSEEAEAMQGAPRARVLGFCTLIFAALCMRSLLAGHALTMQYHLGQQMAFTDDAFYYVVLAKHLAFQGRSTFDGTHLTNGYHPLWMLLLTLQYKLAGTSLLLTRCMEYCLGLGTLICALRVARLPGIVLNVVYTLGIFLLLSRIAFNGMETTLFAFCFALFTDISARRGTSSAVSGVRDGLLAAAAVLSRIDAAVFVLPQLYFVADSRKRRVVAFGAIAVCLLAYVALNRHLFGTGLPISGEVKSLGGLQLNLMFLRSFTMPFHPVNSLLYLGLFFWLCSSWIVRRTSNQALRNLMLAYMIGFGVFLVRLTFFSSWRIWPWYNYPALIGFMGSTPTVLIAMRRQALRLFSHPQLAVATGAVAVAAILFFAHRPLGHRPKPVAYYVVNQRALTQYASLLDGSMIAMGDRAGDFAYQYSGGVDQLEGLMNDKAYFETIRSGGDVGALLCTRNVRFIASYEADLGDYGLHDVQTIRARLSQYAAPRVTVSRADEVGRVSDPQMDEDAFGEPNRYLYLWRLPCAASTQQARLTR